MSYKYSLIFLFLFMAVNAGLKAQPNPKSTLPEVAELFNGQWEGKGKTPEGEEFNSQLIFNWTLDKNFIEVKNIINTIGKPEQFALTIYGWQPVLGKLAFWSFDKHGTINEGLAELDGTILKHEWRSFGQSGEILDWRSTLEKTGVETFIFTVFDNRNFELMSVKYFKK